MPDATPAVLNDVYAYLDRLAQERASPETARERLLPNCAVSSRARCTTTGFESSAATPESSGSGAAWTKPETLQRDKGEGQGHIRPVVKATAVRLLATA